MENPQFREIVEGQGVTFWLPKRKIKALKIVGLFLVIFAMIPGGVAYGFCVDPFQEYLETGEIFLLIFSIFGLIPLLIALAMFFIGLLMITSGVQCRIRVNHDTVENREYLGFFRKTWSYPRSDITAISCAHSSSFNRVSETKTKLDFLAICLSLKNNPRGGILAPGYPNAIIEPLSTRLSEELAVQIEADAPPILNSKIAKGEDAETSIASTNDEPIPDQPESSIIEFEDRPEGLAVRVPPVGIRKGSKGLFMFAMFWNLLTLSILGFLVYLIFIEGDSEAWVGLAFMSIFVAVGVGTLLAAVNMGKRSADILVLQQEVIIKRQSIFGEKVIQHALDTVKDFRVGPSGMEVNQVPVMELQLYTDQGKSVGMLSQLPNEELYWLAAMLEHKRMSLQK